LGPILARISKEILLEQLESDLKNHQRKYDYHKKISMGYLELIEQTRQHLEAVYSNAN